jgi:hypothetical protein
MSRVRQLKEKIGCAGEYIGNNLNVITRNSYRFINHLIIIGLIGGLREFTFPTP